MINLFKKNNEPQELTYSNLFKKIDELETELKNYENGYLETENKMLKEENQKLDNLCFNLTQENAILENRIEYLEQEQEINERLDTDKKIDEDYYNTKELDNKMLSDALDKCSDERDTYAKTINRICDKFNISYEDVFDIMDDIESNKSQQVEKTL